MSLFIVSPVFAYYHVFQNDTYLNSFSDSNYAIEYAKKWDYTKIVDDNNSTIWNNYGYCVFQNNTYLNTFLSFAAAEKLASKYADSKITDALTNEIVWTFLGDATIKTLFESNFNEDNNIYDLADIKWQEGSFSKKDIVEALVSFYDNNQCHAAGYSELWLLRFENGWQIVRKIEDTDWVSFKVLDIEGDGKSEVWITGGGGNQGYFGSFGKLLVLDINSTMTLYTNSGFDYTGAGEEGEALCMHEMDFRDIDNDGILEIIDLEKKKTYTWTGPKFNSNYVETSSKSKKSTFKI